MRKTILFFVLVALVAGTQSALAKQPLQTPDGGSTLAMLGAGFSGLAMVLKQFRRQ